MHARAPRCCDCVHTCARAAARVPCPTQHSLYARVHTCYLCETWGSYTVCARVARRAPPFPRPTFVAPSSLFHKRSLATGGSIVNMLDLFNFCDPGEAHAIDILSIDYNEFRRAMRVRCHYEGPDSALRAFFKSLDVDDSGHVDQHEMFECAHLACDRAAMLSCTLYCVSRHVSAHHMAHCQRW